MGEGNQSDTQILNNFVETLSAPLQQAMAEGSPKVVVESITSVVNSLEPELAAAFRSGSPSVIQAVLGGATTTQMVVNDLIRTGSGGNVAAALRKCCIQPTLCIGCRLFAAL